jgi:arylformamidase
VWPGDTPLSREVLLDFARGDNLTLSTQHGTVHLGAHADAPIHYAAGAATIEQVALEPYLGTCQVLDVPVPRRHGIVPADVRQPIGAPRVLLRTGSFPNPERFNEDFAPLTPELIDWLAAEGVRLIGVDTPSVDDFASKDLPSHLALHRHRIAVLEGLVLEHVQPGVYELIALPLRLVGFDASPVRAVLRPLPGSAPPRR